MIIGIELRQLVIGASGGISQLVKGICESLFILYPEHQFLVFCTPFNRAMLESHSENIRFFTLSSTTFFSDLDRIAVENNVDVLFRTYPMEDTLQFPLNKQIFLIPDIQHEVYPEFFSKQVLQSRRASFSKALNHAGAIGTISEFAKKSLYDFSETKCDDIFLMEPSLQKVHSLTTTEDCLTDKEKALIPQTPFFFFPANIWKHKNHTRLLQAFRLLLKNNPDLTVSLILTGNRDGWKKLHKNNKDLPVLHLGFIRPEFFRILMERAQALVFFTLYEGFGMPLLEAFNTGTPVLCSDTTSLPEVGGDAVITCSPLDISAMANAMKEILKNRELRETLVQRGKARLNAYSWERSAHNLFAACNRVAEKITQKVSYEEPTSTNLPLVSIVTPSYNQGRFLKRTIDSVLSQDYPHIEYIVIDGGSTDDSVDILSSYSDRFFWISEPDNGQTHAINKGMKQAKGEIFAYLNSDDVLTPGAIQKVVDFFLNHPTCDMVYGQADYINEHDNIIGTYRTDEYSFNRLSRDCMICQPSAFWRRRVVEKIGLFDEQLHFVMDYDYWLRIAKAGMDIHFLHEKLSCSRLYPETKTLSGRIKIFQEIFNISKHHIGYTHLNYYQGYWHHLIYEKKNTINQIVRFFSIKNLHLPISKLHYHWARRTQNFSNLTKRIKEFGKIRFKAITSLPKSNISGFFSDNWLSKEFSCNLRKRAVGEVLYIGGITPMDSTMLIMAGKKRVGQFQFTAHQYQKVSIPNELVNNKRIYIQFTESFIDAAGRELAFLIHDTNFFSERDTWAT
ncbi:glycosyltransferase [Legionella parisiensis]|uniref:Chondroitin synthase n=1 Tax=Legionella parisiensis TaxID=45071 RepID=A0A1E5JL86_9GAMM|nr:glycosyltransferase [Legionella parisiensis]KTD43972.1 glycosyltransferase [Legionella parisiensis]OEH45272.1 Chondroitin synthase [Legionella parisiensis]STX76004.1 glycosyltransferase [Legionella parisiensis]